MSDTMKLRFASFAEAHDGKNPIDLGHRLVAVDAELDAVSRTKAMLESEKEFLRTKLAEKMAAEGVDKFGVNGKRIRVQEELFVSVPAERQEIVIQTLKDTGNGDVVKETVHPSTLKSLVKQMRDRAKESEGLPDPTLASLLDAGVALRAVDMARFY